MALGQDLEGVLFGTNHHVEHVGDELVGNVLVKEVAHRIDEHDARAMPAQRQLAGARATGAGRSPARRGAPARRASAQRRSRRSNERTQATPSSTRSPDSRWPRSTQYGYGRPCRGVRDGFVRTCILSHNGKTNICSLDLPASPSPRTECRHPRPRAALLALRHRSGPVPMQGSRRARSAIWLLTHPRP